MKYDRRTLAVVFAVSIFAMVINQIMSSPLAILDTDPSTYVIVPLVMLPLFAFFTIKENIIAKPTRRSMAIGLALFAVFLLLVFVSKFLFYYESMSFRLDMLFLPLAIAGIASIMFGEKNVAKFKWMMLYAVLASPAFLMPLFKLNVAFASFNTQIVYSIFTLFTNKAMYIAPTYININGVSISIGETCAGIGALIGIIMFLLPLAYFYDGKRNYKAYWVLSGFLLLLFLNIVRMAAIGGFWLFYGANSTVFLVHSLAGPVLFYISIVAMLLVVKKYKLNFPKKRKGKEQKFAKKQKDAMKLAIIVALALAMVYFAFSYNYVSATILSPTSFQNQQQFEINSTASLKLLLGNTVDMLRAYNFSYNASISQSGNQAVLYITNETISMKNPIIFLATSPNVDIESELLYNDTLVGIRHYVAQSGYVYKVYKIDVENVTFYAVRVTIPKLVSNQTISLESEYFIMPGNISVTRCAANPLYNIVYNNINFMQDNGYIDAFCLANKLVN